MPILAWSGQGVLPNLTFSASARRYGNDGLAYRQELVKSYADLDHRYPTGEGHE
jgi:hypothetical protein